MSVELPKNGIRILIGGIDSRLADELSPDLESLGYTVEQGLDVNAITDIESFDLIISSPWQPFDPIGPSARIPSSTPMIVAFHQEAGEIPFVIPLGFRPNDFLFLPVTKLELAFRIQTALHQSDHCPGDPSRSGRLSKQGEPSAKRQWKLGRELLGAGDLKEVLTLAIAAAMEIPGVDAAAIYLVDESDQSLVLAQYLGISDLFALNFNRLEKDQHPHREISEGRPIYRNRDEMVIPPDTDFKNENFGSFGIVPIMHRERLIASLHLGSRSNNHLSGSFRTSLEIIAFQLGSSLIRLQTEQKSKESLEKIEKRQKAHLLQLEAANRDLRMNDIRLRSLLNCAPLPVFTLNRKGEVTYINRVQTAKSKEEVLGLNVYDHILPEYHDVVRETCDRAFKTGEPGHYEARIRTPDGQIHWFSSNIAPMIRDNQVEALMVLSTNIDERIEAENSAKKQQEFLEFQAVRMEEINVAMEVLIRHNEQEKKNYEQQILTGLRKLVFPFIERLKKSGLHSEQKTWIKAVEHNLNEITNPFSARPKSLEIDLTPTELLISTLIKQGKTNEQIGRQLKISPNTIKFHRKNIRRKFGLKNTKVNLSTYLRNQT